MNKKSLVDAVVVAFLAVEISIPAFFMLHLTQDSPA